MAATGINIYPLPPTVKCYLYCYARANVGVPVQVQLGSESLHTCALAYRSSLLHMRSRLLPTGQFLAGQFLTSTLMHVCATACTFVHLAR